MFTSIRSDDNLWEEKIPYGFKMKLFKDRMSFTTNAFSSLPQLLQCIIGLNLSLQPLPAIRNLFLIDLFLLE